VTEATEETTTEEKTEGIKRTTLLERGPVLPIGVLLPGGGIGKDIVTRNWTFKQERSLGERRKVMGDEGDNMARYVSSVLVTMCPMLGGQDFNNAHEQELNEIKVGQMWLPDVMYAYVWLRYKALGHELPLTLTSPYTKQKFDWVGDLKTLHVKVPDTQKDVLWEYDLRDPFPIRGKMAKRLVLGPQRWNMVESINPGNATDAIAKAMAIKGSIHLIPDVSPDPIALTDNDLDDMSKLDIETLAHRIDLNGVGPIMVLEVDDPTVPVAAGNKPRKFLTQVDWRYDSFFVISSRS
jgi:hypothetical protein